MKRIQKICLVFVIICASSQAVARQYPSPKIPELLADSDVVVLGSVSEIPGRRGELKTALSVERVFKGAMPGVDAVIDLGESKRVVPALARHGVFFFRLVGGRLTPTRADLPFVLAPLEGLLLPEQSGDALSNIAAGLASVYLLAPEAIQERRSGVVSTVMLVRRPSALGSGKMDLADWGPPSSMRQAEEVYRIATDELRSIPYDVRRGYLARVVGLGVHLPQSIWAVSSMIEAGDLSAAVMLKSYLLHLLREMSLTSLGIMLALQRSPPVDGLGAFADYLLASDSAHIRQGAVSALLNLPADVRISNLALVLRDDDADIRQGAVSLACERTPQCPK